MVICICIFRPGITILAIIGRVLCSGLVILWGRIFGVAVFGGAGQTGIGCIR